MQTIKNWLVVQYGHEEIAKRLGARWDNKEHSWYYPGKNIPLGLEKYKMTITQFEEKMKAKNHWK